MKSKLHFGIVILLIAFLGRSLESSVAPNQQIVIQFSDNDITDVTADIAIESIIKQLENFGAKDITIGKNEVNQLKITYYSDTNVERIQDELFKGEGFKIAYDAKSVNSKLPKSDQSNTYELTISEIGNTQNINWDFEGSEIVEINHKTDRFSNPTVKLSSGNFTSTHHTSLVKNRLVINVSSIFATDTYSYKIPEVRAGPSFS